MQFAEEGRTGSFPEVVRVIGDRVLGRRVAENADVGTSSSASRKRYRVMSVDQYAIELSINSFFNKEFGFYEPQILF